MEDKKSGFMYGPHCGLSLERLFRFSPDLCPYMSLKSTNQDYLSATDSAYPSLFTFRQRATGELGE